MPRRAFPASPPIYQDPEQLAAQIRRTDSALTSWRGTSIDRRQGWETRRAEADLAMQRRRRMVVGTALAVGLASTAAVAALVVSLPAQPPAISPPRPEPMTPVAVAPLPEPVVAAPVPPPVEVPPPAPVEVAPPVQAPVAAMPPIAAGSLIAPGTASVWRDEEHVWAAFQTTSNAAITLRYLDGAGVEALDPMGCPRKIVGGVRHCTAGRSADRVQKAVASGSAPGSWSVLGCTTDACEEVGRFDQP